MRRSGKSGSKGAAWVPPRSLQPESKGRDPGVYMKKGTWALGRFVPFGRKRPVLRAVVIFAVLMGLFYGLIHSPYVGGDGFKPFLALIAEATSAILNLLGRETSVSGSSVSSPDFAMQIVRGCDAIEPVAAFTAAVIASPVSLWFKAWGILAGALALQVINLIRLVTLFFVGVYFPSALDIVHIDVWQAVFIVLAICFWAIWVQWATRPRTG